ncbi:hypothetical protein KSP39_PZI000933 [Platanthera zijinensis]|uniref:HTH La-type RNA-binding domain-containing protein n=1 Tax=Platanthera zijinensis TaxID=2320716 RepID=A0AAP0C2X0_9ASPA
MASVVDPSSSHGPPRPARNAQAAWSHIVRGEHEQKAVSAPSSPPATVITSRDSLERSLQKSPPDFQPTMPSENPDHVNDGIATASASKGKKLVWNVPSNGSTEGGSVMDAASWPALADAAKASPKSSSSDSLKGLSDGPVSGHLVPQSPSSKPVSTTPNLSFPSNSSSSGRHKPMKHFAVNTASDGRTISTTLTDKPSSGNGGTPNGGLATSSPALSQPSHPVSDRQPSLEPSSKVLANKNINNTNNWDNASRPVAVSSQPHGGNDHHRGYGGGRRGNGGHHNSYGNRRDPERGGYEWNQRNFIRDVHMQQLRPPWGVRPYSRPPAVAAQLFGPPPPPRPFGHNMGFTDMSPFIYYVPAPPHPESFRGLPFAPHPTPPPPVMFYNASEPQRAMLLKQIDYYFSPENLFKDGYLRQHMDEQGWVPISLIASFNRVMQLTSHIQYNTIQYIIDTMRFSSVVEVQGDKIRRRNDWSIWAPKISNHFGSTSSTQSPTASNYEALTNKFHSLGLENSSNHSSMKGSAETDHSRSTSADIDSQQSS